MIDSLFNDLADLLGRAVEVLVVEDIEFFFLAGDHIFGDVRVGTLEAQHHRFLEGVLLVGLDDRSGKVVASQDSAKDVDEDGFDLWVFVEELESLHKLLSFGTAADVEEVSGLTTVQLDDVHSRHGKTGTVDQAADVSTDVNVVQVEFFGVLLASVFL